MSVQAASEYVSYSVSYFSIISAALYLTGATVCDSDLCIQPRHNIIGIINTITTADILILLFKLIFQHLTVINSECRKFLIRHIAEIRLHGSCNSVMRHQQIRLVAALKFL